MMKKLTQWVLVAAMIPLLVGVSGCATVGDLLSSDAVSNLGASDYSKALAEIQKIIGKKKDTSPVDGYEFQRVYKYKGSVCEAKDISWENIWSQSGNAAKDGPPPTVIVTTNGTIDAVESEINEIADLLEDLGLGGTK